MTDYTLVTYFMRALETFLGTDPLSSLACTAHRKARISGAQEMPIDSNCGYVRYHTETLREQDPVMEMVSV